MRNLCLRHHHRLLTKVRFHAAACPDDSPRGMGQPLHLERGASKRGYREQPRRPQSETKSSYSDRQLSNNPLSKDLKFRYKKGQSGRPPSERSMFNNSGLQKPHSELFLDVPADVRRRRITTMSRIENVIRRDFGEKYSLQPFGSTRYGVSSETADLDLVILDPSRHFGFDPDNERKLPAIYDVRRLGRALRASFMVQVIPWSSVPIVKLVDPVTSITCDINVNERLGLYNSELIGHYCDLFPPLRSLLHSIKAWAKPRDFNSPGGRKGSPSSFSSYSLALMTIGFLQHRGYLPNLQANLLSTGPRGNPLEFWIRRPQVMCCDCRFHTRPKQGWIAPDLPAQADLLRSWFRYWAAEFRYGEEIVSIREGGIVVASDDAQSQGGLAVMDPFITTKNAVKSVSRKVVERFKDECMAEVDRCDN